MDSNEPNTQVLAMTDEEFNEFVQRVAKLDAINLAFGYRAQGLGHATPDELAAIEARMLVKKLKESHRGDSTQL